MYIQDLFNPNQKKKLKGNKLVDNSKNLNSVEVEELLSSPLQIHSGILALENETEGKNDMWCHLYLYGLSKLYSCMSKCEPNKNYGLMSLLLQLLEG